MNELFLETERLRLFKIDENWFCTISLMHKDADVMYAWEYIFSDEEVKNWISKNIEFYENITLAIFLR